MNTNDLLALADREAETLTQANQQASAAVVRALTEKVRCLQTRLRDAGVKEKPDQ